MPELPEVESSRRIVEEHLLGRTIDRVATVQDTIVYDGIAPRRFGRVLRGRMVRAVRRKGKHLWLELDRRPWPTFHFGMGGSFHPYREPRDRPRFWKVEIRTETGRRLAMTNPRRLGRIRLLQDPPHEPPISRLGFDPLLDLPPTRVLLDHLARRHGPIKSILLDQGFLAGVGNWIADEVLYQARIDPRRSGSDLGTEEVRALRGKLRDVITRAVAVRADSERFPRGWLFHRRWGRDPEARTRRGEPVRFLTLGGRTTAWVPAVQR